MCKTLLGLLSPSRGSILFDNIDINKIDIHWLRKQISYLPQEVKLFNLTFRENILLNMYSDTKLASNENVFDGILLKTINMVGLNEYINSLPNGINQIIKENGKSLSNVIKIVIMCMLKSLLLMKVKITIIAMKLKSLLMKLRNHCYC